MLLKLAYGIWQDGAQERHEYADVNLVPSQQKGLDSIYLQVPKAICDICEYISATTQTRVQ